MSTESIRKQIYSRIEAGLSAARDIRFEPGIDTSVAGCTLVALWGIYYFQSVSDSVESILLFLLIGNLALTILFPLYYVCIVRGEPLSNVGITKTGWKRALVVSSITALILAPGLLFVDVSTAALVPHIITVGLMLWEPFFIHGFLQIRFERAFGPTPGIILASAAFVLFHVGAVDPIGLMFLGFFGLLHAVLFCVFYRNLLVLWPILWAVGSAQGTVDSIVFGWEELSAYVVILLIAVAAIYTTAKSGTSNDNGSI